MSRQKKKEISFFATGWSGIFLIRRKDEIEYSEKPAVLIVCGYGNVCGSLWVGKIKRKTKCF